MKTLFTSKQFGSILMFGAMLMLAGCGGSSGGGGSSTGTMSLKITDAAVDSADHVYVQFHGLELQSADGKRTTLYYCKDPMDSTKTIVSDSACTTPPAPKQIDLLALNGGLADTLLDSFTLPSGHYSWARLMVETAGTLDSYIVVAGNDFELTIPSGAETGLKVNRGFDVPAGGHADFTIDFDLRKSVVLANNEYLLRPTLRMVDNTMVGAIAGRVDNTLMTVTCDPVNDHPAVYVFAGSGVTPDDIDGIDPDPVTTASVKLDPNDGMYRYKAAFLEAGNYTVAFTCDAALDDPQNNDTLTFSGAATVTVTANSVTTHDFP